MLIEWYHRWVELGDPEIRRRILDYNEDECVATRILLLDGIPGLSLVGEPLTADENPLIQLV